MDIMVNLSRELARDAIMVVRCSDGLKVTENYGNFFRRRPLEMEIPALDSEKTFAVTLRHDGKLQDNTEIIIQCALLYTTADGQRRIRVHNLSLPVTSQISMIYRLSDIDAIVSMSLKQACRQIFFNAPPPKVRESLVNACIDCLANYRRRVATASSSGQLVLPEPLKLLPLCTLGMVKNSLFQSGQRADERAFFNSVVGSMPTYSSATMVVPRLFCLTKIPQDVCIANLTGLEEMTDELLLGLCS